MALAFCPIAGGVSSPHCSCLLIRPLLLCKHVWPSVSLSANAGLQLLRLMWNRRIIKGMLSLEHGEQESRWLTPTKLEASA